MTAPDTLEPIPRRIGPYDIVGRIAGGGMADVFAARGPASSGIPRVVAVKQPKRDAIEEAKTLDMFLDESRLASRVKSPHCVETYEIGLDDEGKPYLVMPFVIGVSVARLLARVGALPPAIAAEIGAQTASGLHDAHQAKDPDGMPLGIVHRDVSPQNVLVGTDGRVRVADFGVAHAFSRITRTRTGQLKGKLGYLSPEQIQGTPLDGRSDVFALGIVVWEMLAGTRLVRAKTFIEAHRVLMIAPIPDVRRHAPETPPALAEAVARALSRDRDARFPDAAAFADALRAAVVPASQAEIGSLVLSRCAEDMRRMIALADAAERGGDWSIDVTALAPAGDEDVHGASTRISERHEIEDDDVHTEISAAPVAAPSLLTRVRAWLARTFG